MADYGTDVNTVVGGVIDIDPYWRLVSGGEAVAQSIARDIVSAPGLIDDDEYGAGLAGLVNTPTDAASLHRLEQLIEQRCLADERVRRVDVDLSFADGLLTVQVVGRLSDKTSFRLVLSVSGVTISVLEAS